VPVAPAVGVTETLADATLVPTELVAVTEQLYAVPLVSEDTVIGLELPVAVCDALPAVQVAV
jgi:hypothetical protein